MTANDSTTRVVAASDADVGPGARLREAREAAQLTVGEVAARLRLESRVIERLEHDDFDRLHGPTFVRGYLSGYARLLDLPEGPILEAYERHGYGPPALVSELGRKPEVHVSDFPVRMVTYVIAGLLVVLVVLWWQSRQIDSPTPERVDSGARSAAVDTTATDPSPATGSDVTPASETASPGVAAVSESAVGTLDAADMGVPRAASDTAPAAAGSGAEVSATQPAQSIADSQGSDDPPPQVAFASDTGEAPQLPESETTPAPAVDAGGATAHDAAASADAGGGDGDTVSAAASAGEESATTSSGDAPEAVPAARPAPLPGSDVLAIQLSRESWIEIYDRGGGRLYYSLAREGSEVVVQGAGPMRVLLGEVQGAEVAYNGEPYDLSRFEGRSVVRFTVGELSGTGAPQPPAASEEPATGESGEPTARLPDGAVADAREAIETPAPTAPLPAPAVASDPDIAAPSAETAPILSRPDS